MKHLYKSSILHIFLLASILAISSCAHSSLGRLVGSDRDEHGCIGSAGYTWSYALHDCVRLWEAGERFDAGPRQTFLVFSTDSTFAEIFADDGTTVLCRRVKGTEEWKAGKKSRKKGWVKVQNGVLCVNVNDFTYTKRAGD